MNAAALADAIAQVLEAWRHTRRHLLRRHAAQSAVHAWRVASRRLLALEELLSPAAARSTLSDLLHEAFHAAGALRDTQLAIVQLRQLAGRQPAATRLAQHLHRSLGRRRDQVTRRVGAVRPRKVRDILRHWQSQLPQRLAPRMQRRLARACAGMPGAVLPATPAALHRHRVRLKKLRYMREFCAAARLRPGVGDSMPRQYEARQQRLGRITDLQTLLALIEHFGARHPRWYRRALPLRRELKQRRAHAVAALRAAAASTYGQAAHAHEESPHGLSPRIASSGVIHVRGQYRQADRRPARRRA